MGKFEKLLFELFWRDCIDNRVKLEYEVLRLYVLRKMRFTVFTGFKIFLMFFLTFKVVFKVFCDNVQKFDFRFCDDVDNGDVFVLSVNFR